MSFIKKIAPFQAFDCGEKYVDDITAHIDPSFQLRCIQNELIRPITRIMPTLEISE